MKNIIKQLYKSVTPVWAHKILVKIINIRGELAWKSHLQKLNNRIIDYYSNLPSITDEQANVINYLKENSISVFPYDFAKNYKVKDIKVFIDDQSGLKYVLLDGKKVFYKRSLSKKQIKTAWRNRLREQDIQSPHRYLLDKFDVNPGDTVADIGVGEGNFAISVIEKAKKIYIFETSDEWIEALTHTFEPWADKVVITKKYVSNTNTDNNITLDKFFADNNIEVNFLKIDVDGAEKNLLEGSEKLLAKNLKIAICTYHKKDDAGTFSKLLMDKGFSTSFSKGYMIFLYDKNFGEPYLRHGLIRAVKNIEF